MENGNSKSEYGGNMGDMDDESSRLYMARYESIDMRKANLPHWQQGETCVFVTFRQADSIPQEKLRKWMDMRAAWLDMHPVPWNENDKAEYCELFGNAPEKWLDRGHGSCLLARDENRKIVCDALRYFDGERYSLYAFVVMPNHVHALFNPIDFIQTADIMHSWKSFTAKKILGNSVGNSGRLVLSGRRNTGIGSYAMSAISSMLCAISQTTPSRRTYRASYSFAMTYCISFAINDAERRSDWEKRRLAAYSHRPISMASGGTPLLPVMQAAGRRFSQSFPRRKWDRQGAASLVKYAP